MTRNTKWYYDITNVRGLNPKENLITRLDGTLHPENVDNLCYYLVLRFKRLKTNNQLYQPLTQICNRYCFRYISNSVTKGRLVLVLVTLPVSVLLRPVRVSETTTDILYGLLPPHDPFPLHGPGVPRGGTSMRFPQPNHFHSWPSAFSDFSGRL